MRDSSFGASDPFLAFKPPNRQQQAGGTIGGPLKRNKAFFFLGSDQHLFREPNVVEFVNGASQVAPQPATGPYTPGDYDSTDQAPVFAIAAQLSSLAGEYPAAQIGNASFGKIDINLTPKTQLALRTNVSRYAIDDGQDALVAGQPATVQNSYDPAAERGPSVTDQRQRLVAAFSADLRLFLRGHELLGHFFNHWQISSIVNYGSGRPINATVAWRSQPGRKRSKRPPSWI